MVYTSDAEAHLHGLTARERALVVARIGEQLQHQPEMPTRNRKRMRKNPLAVWELRVGDLRVYYNVIEEPEACVEVRAVGVKIRNQVRLGNEVKEL